MFVGFACAVGVDMGFNATHHHQEEAVQVRGHASKKQHHHHHEEASVKVHVHADGKKHHHEKNEVAEHKHSDKDAKEDCCNDGVVKISQTDKVVPQGLKMLSPVFLTVFVAEIYDINVFYPSQVNTSNKYFVRGHHPPISDICIAIQRFQI